jgi:hypothetical protein
MKRSCLVIMLVLLALLAPLPAGAAGSTLTEKEAPTLSEDRLAGVIRNEHCIILYYDPVAESRDDEAWSRFQATPLQLADRLMKAMMAMADRVQASGKFYKVNCKGFSPDAIARILADTGTVQKRPESPSIVTYVLNRPIAYRFRGTARPDMLPWFVHEVMGYFIYAVKTDKGTFCAADGRSPIRMRASSAWPGPGRKAGSSTAKPRPCRCTSLCRGPTKDLPANTSASIRPTAGCLRPSRTTERTGSSAISTMTVRGRCSTG